MKRNTEDRERKHETETAAEIEAVAGTDEKINRNKDRRKAKDI